MADSLPVDVLMTNHVHLLVSADRAEAPGALMKALDQLRELFRYQLVARHGG